MPDFAVNTHRFDPYKNFKFRVKWDGRFVAGVSKMTALKRTTEVVRHRHGGEPNSSRKSPGGTDFEAITLERRVPHDTNIEPWAARVWNLGAGLRAESSLKDFREEISIEVYDEASRKVLACNLFRCWASSTPCCPTWTRTRRPSPSGRSSSRTRAGRATSP